MLKVFFLMALKVYNMNKMYITRDNGSSFDLPKCWVVYCTLTWLEWKFHRMLVSNPLLWQFSHFLKIKTNFQNIDRIISFITVWTFNLFTSLTWILTLHSEKQTQTNPKKYKFWKTISIHNIDIQNIYTWHTATKSYKWCFLFTLTFDILSRLMF